MTATSLKFVSDKLKNLPDTLIEEVENYIDFLVFKHSQEANEIPQWQKDEVSKRIERNEKPVDAFQMINDLDQ